MKDKQSSNIYLGSVQKYDYALGRGEGVSHKRKTPLWAIAKYSSQMRKKREEGVNQPVKNRNHIFEQPLTYMAENLRIFQKMCDEIVDLIFKFDHKSALN